MDDELRQALIGIYETLRYEAEIRFQLQKKLSALETALLSNKSFSEIYASVVQNQAEPEADAQHSALLAALELQLRGLRGEPKIGQA